MLIRIISLVVILTFLKSVVVLGEEHNFIYPQNKPEINNKTKIENKSLKPKILPNKKPLFKTINSKKINFTLPRKKPITKKVKIPEENLEILKKDKLSNLNEKVSLILPKKKPSIYKNVKKTAKKSQVLNQKDFVKAKKVFEYIDKKQWNSAIKLSKNIKDKEFKNLVLWIYLKQSGNLATFDDYRNFINKNNDYPRINRLRYLAEHKISIKKNSPRGIISWFEETPPLSGTGKIKLGEALMSMGDKDNSIKLIKEGWETADLSKRDLRYYRNKFKNILNSNDHIKRADYLAWNRKYWDLKRMLRYLPKNERALYNARQILMSNSYGVDKAITDVPTTLKKNIGLEYDRLKWRNRRGRLESSLQILNSNSNKSEDELVRADLWWKQRESIVRSLIYKKKYKIAYKVASEHSLTSGPDFASAEWLSGWVALTFLNSGEYAINHFNNFYNNVGYPISLARGAYWLGKSYQSLGENKKAEKYFVEASKFLTTYYGQLALKELDETSKISLIDESNFSKDYEKEFSKNKLIKHVILLKELNKTQYGKDIFMHLSTLNVESGSEVLAAKLATDVGRFDFAIQISKKASYQKRFFNQFNYPIIDTPREVNKKIMPQPELILAIIRQESEFDAKANSYAGARGMMQLMKYTAKTVAKNAKLPYSISALTQDPKYNIKLGSYYLNSLLIEYNGVYPFAIAAYNAGPRRVKTWRRVNGDPTKNELSYVDWIELIRFKETRNYVQRVMENINVYKYMLNNSPVELDGFTRK